MRTKAARLLVMVMICLTLIPIAHAGMINYERRNRKLEQNQTPAVSLEQQWRNQIKQALSSEPTAKSREEREFDFNRDGSLQREELIAFLNELIGNVEDNGSYYVRTELVKIFDKNKDDRITAEEADVIKQVIKEKEN